MVSILNDKKIKNNKAIQNLNLNFQSDTNVLSYSYEEKTISGNPIYVPQDYILNDYSVSQTTNHENDEIDITVAGKHKHTKSDKPNSSSDKFNYRSNCYTTSKKLIKWIRNIE